MSDQGQQESQEQHQQQQHSGDDSNYQQNNQNSVGGGGERTFTDRNKMLLLNINNAVYPITTDIIRAALKNIGELERCDVKPVKESTRDFNPDGTPRKFVNAVIAFHDASCVERCLNELQGRAIYPDCCFLDFHKPKMGGVGGPM